MKLKADMKRRLILDTTKQFLRENDLRSLTLDAIAKNANISKGGLLYHFPSKETLLKGLAQYIFDEYSFHFYTYAENDGDEIGKWTRALIETSRFDLEHNGELSVGILAISFLEPEIAENISERYMSILKKLEHDKINPITTTIVRCTLDGIYYSRMLNVAPLEKEKIDEVMEKLLKMTKGSD